MKRNYILIINIIIIVSTMVTFIGCSDPKPDTNITNAKGIDSIEISSMPPSMEFAKKTKDTDSIKIISDYFNSLTLKKTQKNPNEYVGMSFLIKIKYADGSTKEIIHFGNMFLKEGDGEFYEMEYEQAEKLENIVKELK